VNNDRITLATESCCLILQESVPSYPRSSNRHTHIQPLQCESLES